MPFAAEDTPYHSRAVSKIISVDDDGLAILPKTLKQKNHFEHDSELNVTGFSFLLPLPWCLSRDGAVNRNAL